MDDLEEGELSPEEKAEIKKNIEEAENSPAVKRELRKVRFKNRLSSLLGVFIMFACFFAFTGLVIATGNKPESNFWIIFGVACVITITGIYYVIEAIYSYLHKKSVARPFGKAVFFMAISIILFAVVLCSILPSQNVMCTAFMLLAAFSLICAVTVLLKNFKIIGGGNFKNLSPEKRRRVVAIYVIESILAAGMIVGGVFFMMYISIPCIVVGIVVFYILLGPLIMGRH